MSYRAYHDYDDDRDVITCEEHGHRYTARPERGQHNPPVVLYSEFPLWFVLRCSRNRYRSEHMTSMREERL